MSNKLGRRDFLVMATTAAASTLVSWQEGQAQKTAPESVSSVHNPQNANGSLDTGGIAVEHFENARKRAAAIVAKMTPTEKITQFGTDVPAVPGAGLSAHTYYASEALHGLIHEGPVTSFPLPLALGCSWNRSLLQKVFTAVSDEIWAWHKKSGKGGQGLSPFSPPTVNMGTRDPRWGRIAENYSEDPYLVGQMAIYTIHGMQGDNPRYLKTICCAKHFIGNDTEDDREISSSTIDPRSFWEYYTRGFEACVRDGHVFTVMSSYNAVNGIPTTANRALLTGLLRDRWGFRGYVVSDCDAVEDIFDHHHFVASFVEAAALAVNAGCDINCGQTLQRYLGKAVEGMLVTEATVDHSLVRSITGRVLLGEFDPPESNPYSSTPISCLESPAHRELAREAARQSIVLFKNDHKMLPLDKNNIKKLAVIGPMADACHLGNYSGSPNDRVSPLRGIREALGISGQPAHYRDASEAIKTGGGIKLQDGNEGHRFLSKIHNGSWAAFSNVSFGKATEIHVRVASEGAGGRIEVHLDSLNGPQIAEMTVPNTSDWQHWVDVSSPIKASGGVHTVYLTFAGGEGQLFSFESFRLTPITPFDEPASGSIRVAYALGCHVIGNKDQAQFDEAVHAARAADVVLMFVGVSQQIDGEGHDRKYIHLSGAQHELAEAVFAANPKTILVISSNAPVAVNWEAAHLPAIVGGMFLGGQQGHALADVLFGGYNPGGKLNTTWYRSTADLPDFHDYNVRHGRTYMWFNGNPLFPFGHGLSYTQFSYKNISLTEQTLAPGGTIGISFDLTNSGERDGDEVVQLYVSYQGSKVNRPTMQLANFERIHLKAGENRKITLRLDHDNQALLYWDEAKYSFVSENVPIQIMVGSSSADIRLKEIAQLKA